MEKKEREERKNNIIIRGLKGKEMGEVLSKKVEGFIGDRIKVKTEVKFVRRIGNGNIILAKIDTFEGKIKIMVNKKILGTEDIHIYRKQQNKKRKGSAKKYSKNGKEGKGRG